MPSKTSAEKGLGPLKLSELGLIDQALRKEEASK